MRIQLMLFWAAGMSCSVVTALIRGIPEDEEHLTVLPADPYTTCQVQMENKIYTIGGCTCMTFPSNYSLNATQLRLTASAITKFNIGDFAKYSSLVELIIDVNMDLMELNDDIFKGLSNLVNLTITHNVQLQYVYARAFSGLKNLRHLTLSRNGFTDFYCISEALVPIRNLISVDVSANAFRVINYTDAYRFKSKTLSTLKLSSCSLVYLHGEAFNNLINLTALHIDNNGLGMDCVSALLSNISTSSPHFREIHVGANAIHDPNQIIASVSQTNVSYVDMSRTRVMVPIYQPKPLPSVVHLYLNEISLSGTYDYFKKESLPNLRYLHLAHNRLFDVVFQIDLPELKYLDLTDNCWYDTFFLPEHFRPINATSLETLFLDSNPIGTATREYFNRLPNLKKLSLVNMSIDSFDDDPFIDLNSLEFLDLSRNLITDSEAINNRTFTGLNNLKELHIDGSKLTCLENDDAFIHLPNLQILSLRHNYLLELHEHLLHPTPRLTSLDLSLNQFQKWDQRLFDQNPLLKKLLLKNNQITGFTTAMVQDLQNMDYIELNGNALSCDCEDVSTLFSYINTPEGGRERTLLEALTETNPVCSSPESLRFKPYWSTVAQLQENKECEIDDEIELVVKVTVIVVVVFLLISVPAFYYLRWHIKYWLFLARQALSCYIFPKKKSSGTIGKYTYDAFVSYSNEDRAFVVRLVTMLESHPPHFRLCVFERDFTVGGVITDNVVECLSKSKRTILILSDSFARSTWCQWEMHLAQHKRLFFKDEHHGPLVIIKIGEIMEKHMTPILRYLTKTRIYLQWNSDPIKQKVFWEKLRAALAAPIGDDEDNNEPTITTHPVANIAEGERNNNSNYWIVDKNHKNLQSTLDKSFAL